MTDLQAQAAPRAKADPRRERRRRRVEIALLITIVLVGLILRLIGLRWGVPNPSHQFSYHPDEAPLLAPVWYILTTGDWDPHFYNYGTLYIYLVAICAKIGMALNLIPPTAAGWAQLHVLARVITALMGTATILLVYVVGRRLGGAVAGLGAAALLAVTPAHIVNSHYATVDVPATCLFVAFLAALLPLFGRAEIAWYLLAGVALGLAAATKYTMAIGLIPFILAHAVASGEDDSSPSLFCLFAGVIVAVLAFMAVTPYLLALGRHGFHFNPAFLRDVKFEMDHMRAGGTFAFVNTGSGWIYHLMHSLPAGMGAIAVVLGIIGLGLVAARGGPAAVPLVAFAVVYFGLIGAGKERFLRYTIPLLPVLAVTAAYAPYALWELTAARLGAWKSLAAPTVLGLALFVPTAWYGWQMDGIMAAPDVRDHAAAWLRARQPVKPAPTMRIGVVSTPWYFTPPITPFNGGLRSAENFAKWQAAKPPARVIVIGWDAAALARRHPDYFIVSDAEYADLLRLRRAGAIRLMQALPRRYANLRAFEAPPPLPALRPRKAACPPDWLYTWPRIEVYY